VLGHPKRNSVRATVLPASEHHVTERHRNALYHVEIDAERVALFDEKNGPVGSSHGLESELQNPPLERLDRCVVQGLVEELHVA